MKMFVAKIAGIEKMREAGSNIVERGSIENAIVIGCGSTKVSSSFSRGDNNISGVHGCYYAQPNYPSLQNHPIPILWWFSGIRI